MRWGNASARCVADRVDCTGLPLRTGHRSPAGPAGRARLESTLFAARPGSAATADLRIVLTLLIIVLVALAAVGGYYLGTRRRPPRTDDAAAAAAPVSSPANRDAAAEQ